MVAPEEVLKASFKVLDLVQTMTNKADAIHGLFILSRELARTLGIPMGEMLNRAERITNDMKDKYHPELKAIREYIKNELRD
jgi:hypothetical protein